MMLSQRSFHKIIYYVIVIMGLLGFHCCSQAHLLNSKPAFTPPSPLKLPNPKQQSALADAAPEQLSIIEKYFTPRIKHAILDHQKSPRPEYESWRTILSRSTPKPFEAETASSVTSRTGSRSLLFTNSTEHTVSASSMIRSPTLPMKTSRFVARAADDSGPLDLDQDGLTDTTQPYGPEDLESALALAFMPNYHISNGEQQESAVYGDYVPWTVTGLVGTNPPNSYYHVTPRGFAPDANGNMLGFVRVDYLSLWNADGGLIGGDAACAYSYFGLDDLIQEVSGHDLDAERTVMLLAAPIEYDGYNLDADAYSIYSIYTAAHEGTFFDQSTYYDFFDSPIPANYHLEVAQSLSKHSSYIFNPEFFPITPEWFIDSTLAGLSFDYYEYEIDLETYELLIALADDVFYGCLVERFGDLGGVPPFSATNVGEVAIPLNACHFIQDDSAQALMLASKLTDGTF